MNYKLNKNRNHRAAIITILSSIFLYGAFYNYIGELFRGKGGALKGVEIIGGFILIVLAYVLIGLAVTWITREIVTAVGKQWKNHTKDAGAFLNGDELQAIGRADWMNNLWFFVCPVILVISASITFYLNLLLLRKEIFENWFEDDSDCEENKEINERQE